MGYASQAIEYVSGTMDYAKPYASKAVGFVKPYASKAVDFAKPYASKAMDFAKPYASKAVEFAKPYVTHVTPSNVALGIAAVLMLSGLAHALPGPTLKMQEKAMKVPGRFLQCAGALMMMSGALYYSNPSTGIFAVSLCMGGAFATAAKMPGGTGGMFFSSIFFTFALWSNAEIPELGLSISDGVLCGVAFAAGIAGGVLAPHHRLMNKCIPVKKDDKVDDSKDDKVKEGAKAAMPPSTSSKMPGKASSDASLRGRQAVAKSSSKSRVASPGLVAKKK